MKNDISICLRTFPVFLMDHETSAERTDTITLTRAQLQAAETVGQSCKELITRICDRQGLEVLDIGKPIKRTVTLDLEKLIINR